MLTVSSLTNLPSPASGAQPPSPVIAAPDRVSTRITPVAVTAPLSDERVTDNNQQRGTRQAVALPAQPQAAAAPADAKPAVANGNSAPYVAQMLAQSGQQAEAATESFSRFAPALQYNTLVGYGFVKYKPSDAGVPSRNNPASQEALSGESLHPEAATEYKAYNNTQSRNFSELTPPSPLALIAG